MCTTTYGYATHHYCYIGRIKYIVVVDQHVNPVHAVGVVHHVDEPVCMFVIGQHARS